MVPIKPQFYVFFIFSMVLKVFSTQNVITVVYTFLICFVLLKAAAASPVELGTSKFMSYLLFRMILNPFLPGHP